MIVFCEYTVRRVGPKFNVVYYTVYDDGDVAESVVGTADELYAARAIQRTMEGQLENQLVYDYLGG